MLWTACLSEPSMAITLMREALAGRALMNSAKMYNLRPIISSVHKDWVGTAGMGRDFMSSVVSTKASGADFGTSSGWGPVDSGLGGEGLMATVAIGSVILASMYTAAAMERVIRGLR